MKPEPRLNIFFTFILETENQETLYDCLIIRLSHERCKALINALILIIMLKTFAVNTHILTHSTNFQVKGCNNFEKVHCFYLVQ